MDPLPDCIACTYSGYDDQEYIAWGCPACTCKTVTPTQRRVMKNKLEGGDGDVLVFIYVGIAFVATFVVLAVVSCFYPPAGDLLLSLLHRLGGEQ